MRLLAVSAVASSCVVVWGCHERASTAPSAHTGRYQGIGLYTAGRMWSRGISAAQPKDPMLAKLADDETIIVVVDSNTGEVRQCGNLSGYCIAMNPWTKPLAPSQSAPLGVTKHDAELRQEDEVAANEAAPSATNPRQQSRPDQRAP